nr:hypothetical protein Iba_chr12cCG14960 [Ipomoea batatas]
MPPSDWDTTATSFDVHPQRNYDISPMEASGSTSPLHSATALTLSRGCAVDNRMIRIGKPNISGHDFKHCTSTREAGQRRFFLLLHLLLVPERQRRPGIFLLLRLRASSRDDFTNYLDRHGSPPTELRPPSVIPIPGGHFTPKTESPKSSVGSCPSPLSRVSLLDLKDYPILVCFVYDVQFQCIFLESL